MKAGWLATYLLALALVGCVTTTPTGDDAAQISSKFRAAHDALVTKDFAVLREVLAPSTYDRYGLLKKQALHATYSELEKTPAATVAEVFRVRQLFDAGDLEGMRNEHFFEEMIFRTSLRWESVDDLRLTDIRIAGSSATALAMRGTRPQFRVSFIKQADGWKYDYGSFLEGVVLTVEAATKGYPARALLLAIDIGYVPSKAHPIYEPLSSRPSEPNKLAGILGEWRLRDHPDRRMVIGERELRFGDLVLPIRISRPVPGRYMIFTPEERHQVFHLKDDGVLVTAGLNSARRMGEAGSLLAVGKLEFVRSE